MLKELKGTARFFEDNFSELSKVKPQQRMIDLSQCSEVEFSGDKDEYFHYIKFGESWFDVSGWTFNWEAGEKYSYNTLEELKQIVKVGCEKFPDRYKFQYGENWRDRVVEEELREYTKNGDEYEEYTIRELEQDINDNLDRFNSCFELDWLKVNGKELGHDSVIIGGYEFRK